MQHASENSHPSNVKPIVTYFECSPPIPTRATEASTLLETPPFESLKSSLTEMVLHQYSAVKQSDRYMITIIDKLFRNIANQTQICGPIKALFERLKLPLAKLAISDSGFLHNPNHSARLLLNSLSITAIKYGSEEPLALTNDPIYQQIVILIDIISTQEKPSKEDFSKALEELKIVSNQQQINEELFEKRLIIAEYGRVQSLRIASIEKDARQTLTNDANLIINTPRASEAFYNQAKKLRRGTWFDLSDEVGTTRFRLGAIIKSYNQYIFINRTGIKILRLGLEEMALMLQEKSLIQLDSNFIFENALENVINDIKNAPRKTG